MTPTEMLRESFPQAAATLDRIAKIHQLIDSLEIAQFFEPPSLFDLGKKPQPLMLTADLLATWVQHVSHGTRVRLRSLEAGFLSELCARRFMTAMILARSHMEVAGFATFAEHALLRASDTGNWDELKLTIHKMLFGTSFRFEKNLTQVQDALSLEATTPVPPKLLLQAMDEFLTGMSGQTTHSRGVYALLCEYAHPNIGGAKAFENVLSPKDADGWFHQYQCVENIQPGDVVAATEILLNNMKIGYSNALLLVTGEIEEVENGVCFHKPSLNIGRAVWDEILQA